MSDESTASGGYSADGSFSLVEPFDIDHGELDGVPPQKAFVLGVEWQMVSSLLRSGREIARPIHPENSERIKRMCIRQRRKFAVTENGPDWKWLEVEPS